MPDIKVSEIRQKNSQELDMTLKELREKLRKLRFDLSEKKLKNIREIFSTRKTIAKILTILKERHGKE